ncbi:Fe-S cluster assembly ATPase SufC [Patescibacteria group bacterium]|nr:Fe-S cluster assembly ATPase SufC [Patescibacteria group bacterium]
MSLLRISRLSLTVETKPILKDFNLTINKGQVQALVGPNGSGKSSLAALLMGQPAYQLTYGQLFFNGKNLLNLKPAERSKAGLFVAWQNPIRVSGLNVEEFLIKLFRMHSSASQRSWPIIKVRQQIIKQARRFKAVDLLARDLNDGLSGGEQKRLEALQMAVIKPKLAILDEIDSGLDMASLGAVSRLIRELNKQGTAFLIISHHWRLLKEVKAQSINVLLKGSVVASGGLELINTLNRRGFKDWLKE